MRALALLAPAVMAIQAVSTGNAAAGALEAVQRIEQSQFPRLGIYPIVGGQLADATKYPWVVSLSKGGGPNGRTHQCGGTLLDAQHVLTAAHCQAMASLGWKAVAAGQGHTHGRESAIEHGIAVTGFYPHQAWEKRTNKNDIAIVRLASPVPRLSDFVTLGTQDPSPGDKVKAVGYGAIEDMQPSGRQTMAEALREVTLPVVSHDVCVKGDGDYYSKVGRAESICAGFEKGGKDACQGDSGGPLLDSNGKQVGVVSFGEGCAKPNAYGVYARVSNYGDWIKDTVKLSRADEAVEVAWEALNLKYKKKADKSRYKRWWKDLSRTEKREEKKSDKGKKAANKKGKALDAYKAAKAAADKLR